MTGLTTLWLPILLSAVLVFVTSSIIHMASPWHKSDYPRLPDEDGVMNALRPFNIPPGDYMAPRPSSGADVKSPAYTERRNKGPVVIMTVMPNGPWSMGGSLVRWFVYLIVVGALAAYIAGRALPAGATYLQVFRFVGASAFLAHTMAYWPLRIWYHRALSTTIKATVDGLIYALLTAGVFGWLWPKA